MSLEPSLLLGKKCLRNIKSPIEENARTYFNVLLLLLTWGQGLPSGSSQCQGRQHPPPSSPHTKEWENMAKEELQAYIRVCLLLGLAVSPSHAMLLVN